MPRAIFEAQSEVRPDQIQNWTGRISAAVLAEQEMKSEWQEYPLGLVLAATRSTAGGIVTLMVALCLGTQLGFLALEGNLDLPTCAGEWIGFVLCFFMPISIACIALWGFLYVVLIAWFGSLLIHQDTPRLRTGANIVFPQFACTVIAMGVLRDSFTFDMAMILRLSVITPLVILLSTAPFLVDWLKDRK